MKTRILMVCLGNICRSPLAEGILRSKVHPEKVFVDSAGTISYHEGNPPDPRSVAIASKYGIDITSQRCRKFQVSDFEEFDHIYVMDNSNYNDVVGLARNEKERQKVDLILNLVFPKENVDVPDPYYGGEKGFQNVFKMLDEACETLAGNLKNKQPSL
ncbi:low molecular weight protein-tyrosine-phosphatase [Ascidiimonas aurantiaca]|uniref:low molecular weight protein-tyrosine-phosphatase n=1 Tax=Ascidiimonas aurantiaca TaxID=1685432 RepID=UPI0030EE05E3